MSEPESHPEKHIAIFRRKEVRRAIHNSQWWFVITDVVAALTDSANPQGYFKDMRKRDPQLAAVLEGGGQIAPPLGLEFETAGGGQLLQCWNTEGIFRLVQSIPSPEEPGAQLNYGLKLWSGEGVTQNEPLGCAWVAVAAESPRAKNSTFGEKLRNTRDQIWGDLSPNGRKQAEKLQKEIQSRIKAD